MACSKMEQITLLPLPILYYIVDNPTSAKLHANISKCSKFLYLRNPVAVIKCLHNNFEGAWWTCKDKCQGDAPDERNVVLSMQNGIRYWITEKLDLIRLATFNDCFPHIYKCEATNLLLRNQDIELEQLQSIGACATFLDLVFCKVLKEGGDEARLDEILPFVDKLEALNYRFSDTTLTADPATNGKASTMLAEWIPSGKIKALGLWNIPPGFGFWNICDLFVDRSIGYAHLARADGIGGSIYFDD